MNTSCRPSYAHEDHTADILVVAEGSSLAEAFEQAAKAVFDIITDISSVECRERVEVNVEGYDLDNLLYRWIEELLYYFDAYGLVFSTFKVEEIRRTGEGYRIIAEACGEKFDPAKHAHGTIVKAMTYAQMNIREEDGCWKLSFVVDI